MESAVKRGWIAGARKGDRREDKIKKEDKNEVILPTIIQPPSSRPKLSNTIATSDTWAFQVMLVVKNPSANARDTEDLGLIPGSRRSPGEGNGNHSSIPAWRIPWTEELGRLQSRELQRVGHD